MITDSMITDYAAATGAEVTLRTQSWDGSMALVLPQWTVVLPAGDGAPVAEYTGDMFHLYEEVGLSSCASVEEAIALLAETEPERI